MFSKIKTKKSMNNILKLADAIQKADVILIGAGSGLSTAAGFTYEGQRFQTYFSDFEKKYGFTDMYTGGFYPYETLEEYWAYWSRYIYINRYMNPPKNVYQQLLSLMQDKDYFVLTTNVDHCFQKASFDKNRLFYTQGDYGLFQCYKPCHNNTYDNKEIIQEMVLSQGFTIEKDNTLTLPVQAQPKMQIPSRLIPYCSHCGNPMSMNLRADDSFVQDEGWYKAATHYNDFLQRHQNMNILFLELGVGMNTPGIIKYPFWKMCAHNPNATYACINTSQAYAPNEIKKQSICIKDDIDSVISSIRLSK